MMTAKDQSKTSEPAVTSLGEPLPQSVAAQASFLRQRGAGQWFALLALAGSWLLLFDELRGEWQINPQYSYGWLVPVLAGVLIWRRWPDRPGIVPPVNIGWLAAVAAGLLLLVLPLRVMVEANPEWRLLYWLHGLQVVALSLCFLYHFGGRSWVRFFAPAVVFVLIAVPWPMQLETAVIQGLMRFVAGLTTVIMGLLGIPAVQRGNLIEVDAGLVGIDEACSGVRSLQSAIMISLFLGEMYRFAFVRRGVLLGASIALVLAANTMRTTFLVWAVAKHGYQQMESWHDTAGLLVAVVVMPGLLLLGWLMRRDSSPTASLSNHGKPLPALPRWVGIGSVGWLFVVELLTQAWYRTHETQLIVNLPWSVSWPTEHQNFKKTALPEKAVTILRCTESESATWQDDHGNEWSVFLLRWDPGENSAQLAKGHQPEICLTAAGARLIDDLGMVRISMQDIELNFHHQTFESGPHLLHVFYCRWADRVARNEPVVREDGSAASRLQAVLSGKRHLGQQVLEVIVQGPDSAHDAIAQLRTQLAGFIQRK